MRLGDAAALLDMSEDDLRATKLPIETDLLGEGTGTASRQYHVRTEHVLRLVLHRLGRDRLRKLMADLNAVVLVQRGRDRADFLAQGALPPAQRVALQVLGTVQVRTDVANIDMPDYLLGGGAPSRATLARSA